MAIQGGGFIESWSPLLKSEFPVQVALLMIAFFCLFLPDVPVSDWSSVVLNYDNICNVDRLLMMRKPIPLSGHMSTFWSRITKVINNVHLGNHKRAECQESYNPEKIKNILPDANLMICEETYSWCGRYKKVRGNIKICVFGIS